MTCTTFCTRFYLSPDGHRCEDCGLTAGDAMEHHDPKRGGEYKSGTVDGVFQILDEDYRAWRDWCYKLNALRSGCQRIDLKTVTTSDQRGDCYGQPVYLLGFDGESWGIISKDHECTAWSPFVPACFEYLPTDPNGRYTRAHTAEFVTFAKSAKPGFVTMTLCPCGWFRPESEKTCPHHLPAKKPDPWGDAGVAWARKRFTLSSGS